MRSRISSDKTSTLALRTYLPTDAPACKALFEQLFEAHRRLYNDPSIGRRGPAYELGRLLRRSGARNTWVATRGGRVVGLMGLLPHQRYGEVEPLVVDFRARRRGVARQLLLKALSEARRRRWKYLAVRPVARNAVALRTFHTVGFTFLGQVELNLRLTPTGRGALVPVPGPVLAGRRFQV